MGPAGLTGQTAPVPAQVPAELGSGQVWTAQGLQGGSVTAAPGRGPCARHRQLRFPGGSLGMDVVFSCPGWILSRNTKAVRSRGQSQCFLHGAGAQGGHRQHWTELARGGLGCPDRVRRGAWAPFDFPSTPSEKLQGGVKQRKDPTEYRRGSRLLLTASASGRARLLQSLRPRNSTMDGPLARPGARALPEASGLSAPLPRPPTRPLPLRPPPAP